MCTESNVKHGSPGGDAVQDGELITTEGCQWECHRPAHLWLKSCNVDVKSVE